MAALVSDLYLSFWSFAKIFPGRFIFSMSICLGFENLKTHFLPDNKMEGKKQMGRDREGLLILGGYIYKNVFLHFSALSLKLGFRAHFSPGGVSVIASRRYAHSNVHFPTKFLKQKYSAHRVLSVFTPQLFLAMAKCVSRFPRNRGNWT